MSWESHGREELPAHTSVTHSRGGVRQMFSAFSMKHHKEFLAAGQKTNKQKKKQKQKQKNPKTLLH